MTQNPKSTVGTSPTVGAVIINYNYAHYVGTAIDSALNQTSAFDGIWVVDDGSKDNSLEVIGRYGPKVTLVAKSNGGLMSASIAGIRSATTEYVYLLDADDYIIPEFVEKLRLRLQDRPVKLHCQLIGVDSSGKPFDSIFPTYPSDYNAERMQEDNKSIGFYICPPQSGNIYRRDFLDGLDLDSIDPFAPIDGAPALIAPYFGKVVTIAEPMVYYRSHTGSMSSWGNPTPELFAKEVRIFQTHWKDGCRLSGRSQPPFGDDQPLYTLERDLMNCGLANTSPDLKLVRAFQKKLLETHFPTKHKVTLFIWAGLFLVPSASLRRYLVKSRRSAADRPEWAKWLLRLLRK